MNFRYQRGIRIAKGVWLIVSKRGASLTVGTPVVKLNLSKRGVRFNLCAPNTGVSLWRFQRWATPSKRNK
jgi:hypothetical protein